MPDAGAQDSSSGSRIVPLPAAASEELKAAIRAWPQRDISSLPDPPVTNSEWTANVEQVDVARAAVGSFCSIRG